MLSTITQRRRGLASGLTIPYSTPRQVTQGTLNPAIHVGTRSNGGWLMAHARYYARYCLEHLANSVTCRFANSRRGSGVPLGRKIRRKYPSSVRCTSHTNCVTGATLHRPQADKWNWSLLPCPQPASLSSQEGSPRPKWPAAAGGGSGVAASPWDLIHTGSRPRTRTPRSFLPPAGHSTSFSFSSPLWQQSTPEQHQHLQPAALTASPKSSHQQTSELAQRQHHHPHQPLGSRHWPLVVYSAIRLGIPSPLAVPIFCVFSRCDPSRAHAIPTHGSSTLVPTSRRLHSSCVILRAAFVSSAASLVLASSSRLLP